MQIYTIYFVIIIKYTCVKWACFIIMAVGKQQVLRSVAPLQPESPPTKAAAAGLMARDSPPRLAYRGSSTLREHVCLGIGKEGEMGLVRRPSDLTD